MSGGRAGTGIRGPVPTARLAEGDTMKGKRVAIYTRVGTSDQSVEPQLLDLRRFTREGRWEPFREYFASYPESIDTASPLGSAVFTIVSAVAQLERDIIAERVKAGLRRARQRGKRLGRPRSRVDREKLSRLRSEGLSQREMADRLGVSHATVGRALRGGSETP